MDKKKSDQINKIANNPKSKRGFFIRTILSPSRKIVPLILTNLLIMTISSSQPAVAEFSEKNETNSSNPDIEKLDSLPPIRYWPLYLIGGAIAIALGDGMYRLVKYGIKTIFRELDDSLQIPGITK